MKQGAAAGNVGEVLPAAETAEPELGPWSVFCESAATLEAKAGHHNPEQRSNFRKGIHARRENWLSARGLYWVPYSFRVSSSSAEPLRSGSFPAFVPAARYDANHLKPGFQAPAKAL